MTSPSSPRADSPRNLAVMLLNRIALNLQFRVVYPFLPAISRGLGIPLETVTLLLTVRSITGAAGPLYGLAADRWGRRRMMLAGMVGLVVGALAVSVSPAFGVALAAFGLLGFAKASFDPAAQAYLGDNVPYERRGRVLGLFELAWGLSWLVGIPLSGFAIAGLGWRAPFGLITAIGLIGLVALWKACPSCGSGAAIRPLLGDTASRFPWRRVVPALAVNCFLVAANENLFVVYGEWLESRFGLAVGAIGVTSIVIFAAEITAELASSGLVDRVGKRRAVLAGLALNAGAYLVLPRLAGSLVEGLAGIVLIFLTFEFTIVSLIPLVSELSIEARGTVLAMNAAAASLGRVFSSLAAPRLWSAGGLALNAVTSAGMAVLALTILWLAVREGPGLRGTAGNDTR